MKLVINVPDYIKEQADDGRGEEFGIPYWLVYEIANGTTLPKGHGVLKDVTNLMRGLYTDMQTIEETFTSSDVYKMIDEECPTIIGADKAESEVEE